MENRYKNLILEFEANVKKLIAERNALLEENKTIKAEVARKQEELMQAHKEILDLRKECTLLETASGLGGSAKSREYSKKHLNNLVREIDKCLALLNE